MPPCTQQAPHNSPQPPAFSERVSGHPVPISGLSLSHPGMLLPSESPGPIPAPSRAARVAAAAGLVAALAATGVAPVFAADDPASAPVKAAGTAPADKLGTADAEVLTKAKAKGEKNVTMMVATAPGATEQVTKQLD